MDLSLSRFGHAVWQMVRSAKLMKPEGVLINTRAFMSKASWLCIPLLCNHAALMLRSCCGCIQITLTYLSSRPFSIVGASRHRQPSTASARHRHGFLSRCMRLQFQNPYAKSMPGRTGQPPSASCCWLYKIELEGAVMRKSPAFRFHAGLHFRLPRRLQKLSRQQHNRPFCSILVHRRAKRLRQVSAGTLLQPNTDNATTLT